MEEVTIYRGKQVKKFPTVAACATFLGIGSKTLKDYKSKNKHLPHGWGFTPLQKNSGFSPEEYIKKHRSNMSIRNIAEASGITCDEVRAIYDAHYKEWESKDAENPNWKGKGRFGRGKPVIAIPIDGGEPIYYKTVRDARADGFYDTEIYACLNGRREQFKGYMWRYAENEYDD